MKVWQLQNSFPTITSLSELYLRIRRFFLLVQTKKVNYDNSTSSWKPWRWMKLDLIFSMRDIYINSNLNPLTKFTCSSRSTEFKDILQKVISMNYGCSISRWKPWRWMGLDLIFSMRDIYINSNLNPHTKFTSSSRSTKFKDIVLWNISQMFTKTIPISTRIV